MAIRSAQSMVDAAMERVRTLSIDEARALHGREGVVFVDVRDVRELEREGVIPGAVHGPRGMLEFWFDPASPYYREVFDAGKQFVLFCALGWRSALAAQTLMDMGLPNVAHVEGGFSAWKEAGAPVTEKVRKPSS